MLVEVVVDGEVVELQMVVRVGADQEELARQRLEEMVLQAPVAVVVEFLEILEGTLLMVVPVVLVS